MYVAAVIAALRRHIVALWKDPVLSKVIASGITAILGFTIWLGRAKFYSEQTSSELADKFLVSGHVFDDASGHPIGHAIVSVKDHSESGTTDDLGNFEFRIVSRRSESIRLSLTRPGYKPFDWTVHLPQDRPTSIPLQHR